MEDTVSSIVREMAAVQDLMHSLMHTVQREAHYVASLGQGFPGRYILVGQQIIPELDPVTGDFVPLAVTLKNTIASHEGLYQDAHLGFHQAMSRGFDLVERLQVHEGIGSFKSTQFVGMMDKSLKFVTKVSDFLKSIGVLR